MFGIPKGHAWEQYPQPMQRFPSTSTTPPSTFDIARAGQTTMQEGSSQCMQDTDM